MKKTPIFYIVFIGIFLMSTLASAQQDPQFTHYMYNMSSVNPAYATDNPGVINIGGMYRTQWVGAVGGPKTANAFVHSPIAKRVEAGLSIVSDVIGDVVHENNIYADVAYVIPVSDNNKLSFGIKAGVTLFDVDFNGFQYTDPNPDNAFSENISKTFPNIGTGAFYFSDHYYVGLSVPNLLNSKHIETKDGVRATGVESTHFFLTGGYVFDLNSNLKFKPAFMAKGVSGAPLSLDVTANLLFFNDFEVGAGYRFDDSVSGLVGINITPNLKVGYAYDYTLSNLGRYNSGSHEIFLLFDLDTSNFASKGYEKSPRFF
ncbi:type IX secretion system membrane protein PorP/SprF [Flavobacterium sp. CYK-55]|uniref:PorP/SprF family type IX secretion system membrane protein n=1 Tax=Flavobacterium sp. CYK-55 TaxID=2835529 RepID=UPI001BD0CA25|nr:type IX secretion system membrane protein PorP/SprF [Flavobacterium sp. CYK-55]MBS7786215.1 type IX secretion system membrane protein PorP/SprF [Flavobacterium sp. CYK-55]